MTKTTVPKTVDYATELEAIQAGFKTKAFKAVRPNSEFPELFITVPDSLSTIVLAPLYDVHIGSNELDEALLDRHLDWIARTDNVFSWGGGDLFENVTPGEAKMGHTKISPEQQITEVTKKLAKVQHKMFFSLSGNHEDRTRKHAGMDSAKRLADNLKVPYFPDYCFASIQWRGQIFKIGAHHGAGGGTTAGSQRTSARKDLFWSKPDILWTGHVHAEMVDVMNTVDYDQKTGRMFERSVLILISPSYLKFFGGYAASKRLAPPTRGLAVATLNPDGRIDANVHARGRRL